MENKSSFQNDCPIYPPPTSPFFASSSSSMVQCNQQEQLNQIRIPGDQCGWDWPEELPGIARMHISTIHSDVSSQHRNSGHYRIDGLFPENPNVGYPVTNFLHDGRNGHSLETHNFIFEGSNNSKTCSNSNPVTNKKVIGGLVSDGSTLSSLDCLKEADRVCHSTSNPKDSNSKLDNSFISFSDLWSFKCNDKNFDQQNFDGPFKDRDSISSKCELKLRQPLEQSWTSGSEILKSYQTDSPPYEAQSSVIANEHLKLGYLRDTMFLSFMDREGIYVEQHICSKASNVGNHAVVGKQIFEPSIAKGNWAGFPGVRDHEIGGEFNDIFLFGKKINDKGCRRSIGNSHKAAELNLNCFPIYSEGETMKMVAAQDLVESCKHSPFHRSIHEFEMFKMSCDNYERDFHGVGPCEDFESENKAERKINNETSENFKLLKRKRLHCSVPISGEVHIGASNLGNSFTVTSSGHEASFFKQKTKPIVSHKYGIITNGSTMKQTRIVSMKNVLIAAKRTSNTEHYKVNGILQSKVEGPDVEKVGFCRCCVDHATQKQSNADDCTTGKKEECTCSRTEGYKGRKCFCSWCSVSHCHNGDYRCHVPQDQLNVWLHIHTHKSFARGHLESQKAEFEYDSREQYARFKRSKGWKHLLVYKSSIHGHGLYTSQFIPRGSVVVEYIGEVVGPRVADKRETEYQSGKRMQYKGACYLFKVDKEQIIDGTRKGGIARFVNHSCLPNCVAKVISVRNEKKVVFYADREIYPGEEVTYDYRFKKEDDGEKIHCNCRSRNCRRYLN